MGSSPSKGGGEEWTSEIYFDPRADGNDTPARISDDELKTKFKELIDPSEKILNVRVYKTPLSEVQLTNAVSFHAYTVFETDQWWWSIEKNTEGLTIQRAKDFDAVGKRYRQTKRPGIDFIQFGMQLIKEDEGRKTMDELVDFLYRKDKLNQKYNWATSNCKNLAADIFNFVARYKNWNHIGIF